MKNYVDLLSVYVKTILTFYSNILNTPLAIAIAFVNILVLQTLFLVTLDFVLSHVHLQTIHFTVLTRKSYMRYLM